MRTIPVVLAWLLCGVSVAAPPKVDSFFPAGGQRGQTVAVTAAGDLSTWPAQLWSDQPGVTATAQADKGKFSIAVAPDAPAGIAWLRAYNAEGAASLKPFVIGTLPEVVEVEPNDGPGQPQAVPERIVINGRIAKSGDVDGFAFPLKRGQTLVASVQANQVLGSPMDGVLQVCELVERRGKQEAFVVAQNHDAIGLDPQLSFTTARDGNYLVRLFAYPAVADANVGFSGNESFIYRLTITSGPFASHALPLAVRRGQPTDVRLLGWNVPAEGMLLNIPPVTDPFLSQVPAFHGDVAGATPLAVVDHPVVVEQPGQTLELPVVISGQVGQAKEVDSFTFAAQKGVKLRVECESRSLGYPLRPVLRVQDATGKRLAAAEPNEKKRDTELAFTPPDDGKYVITVEDEHRHGGLRFAYRLTMEEARPDFDLTVAADNFVLAADKPLEIPVTLAPREGLTEAVEIKAIDLPAGVTCEPVKSAAPPKAGEAVKLVLKATPETAAFSGPFRVVGTAGALTRAVHLAPSQSTAIWLTIKK
jgi:hypothetical protein